MRQLAMPTSLVAGAALAFVFVLAQVALAAGSFAPTGSMSVGRWDFTATRLLDGKVLVVGGLTPFTTATAELYDPTTGVWTATGSLATARNAHTAALLGDGRVLVAGGLSIFGRLASAEIYDPATGSWSNAAAMTVARSGHEATRLNDGTVLVVGGEGFFESASVELFDPTSETWSIGPSMNRARAGHTSTLLADGRVLVAGGSGLSAETYDPVARSWTLTGSMNDLRRNHTATLLPGGRLLVAGGSDHPALATAELFDPATGSWSSTGSLANQRDFHTATLLADGSVLVVAGSNGSCCVLNAETYQPATGTWSTAGTVTARQGHTATLLTDGRVLLAGGKGLFFETLSTADLYTPAVGGAPPVIAAPANIVTSTSAGACSATVDFAFTASDDSGIVTVTSNPPSGSVFPVGATTVTGTATDPDGNTATATFTVTVNDNEAPRITVPSHIVVGNDPGRASAVVTYSYTVSDNCPGVTSASSHQSGSSFPIGTTIVSVSALDSHLLVGASFDVTVVDTEAPTIRIDSPTAGRTYAYGAIEAVAFSCADNVGVVSCASDPAGANLETSRVGARSFSVTASDAAGNVSRESVSYTVDCPSTIRFPIAIFNEGGHQVVAATLEGTETRNGDLCDVTYRLVTRGTVIGGGTFTADHTSPSTTTISNGTLRLGRATLPLTFSGSITREGASGTVTLTVVFVPSGRTRTVTLSFTELASGAFVINATR